MKILIGTPIHQIKDYAMEKWLKNVGEVQKVTPARLLMVDNSPDLMFMEKVQGYCQKLGTADYEVAHINVSGADEADQRINRSREAIRQYLVKHDYDAWFSWECDQIIPADALARLVGLMEEGGYTMVAHGSPERQSPATVMAAFGVTLIKKQPLVNANLWHTEETWLKQQILAGGGNYIQVYGVIKPIYHLNYGV